MDEDFYKTLLVEFIEVLIHQIIKLKRIYPDGIYGKRRKYNLAVFMSEHPSVNEFIREITEGIHNKLSDPTVDIEGVVLVISKGNQTDQKFRMKFPGFQSLNIDPDPDPDPDVDTETEVMECLDLNFASVLLRLAEVMKDQKREAGEEDGEKRDWLVQVESTDSTQTDSEGVLLTVFDFEEPFHFRLEIETYR